MHIPNQQRHSAFNNTGRARRPSSCLSAQICHKFHQHQIVNRSVSDCSSNCQQCM